MDAESNGDVVAVPEESITEKVAALRLETPEESTEPEKPPAAEQESEQLAVNGHNTHVTEVPLEKDLDPSPSPMASPDQDGPSEKISEPAEQDQVQQPEPEAAPEPEPEAAPEPEPEAAPEPEPEAAPEPEERAEPEVEPQAVPELVVIAPPGEQGTSQAEPAIYTEKMVSSESEVEPPQEVAESAPAPPEKSAEKVEASPGEATENEMAPANKSLENEEASSGEPVESEVASSEEAHVSPAEVKSEQEEAEPPEEEGPDPASGSLSFVLLENSQTRDALLVSRTLVVLRGLPGSGKTFLARAIADAYKNNCYVISADDHGIKPEAPGSCADGYKALDDAVVARCGEGTTSSVLVVVDDTNHTLDRLVRLSELAKQHLLVPVFLEPQTEWSRDPEQLSKKTKRGLDAAKVESMKAPLLETSLPLYFGWFLLSPNQDKVRCMALDFVKTLDTLDSFKKRLPDFTGKAEAEVDLEHYFKAKGALHCTTKFCDYGKADGAKEYAQNPDVKNLYGSVSELSLSALFVTPRTVGARVSLTEEQLQLWPADAEKEAESTVPGAASLGPGSRAHVTLGCADGVQPVQTGLDLLEILVLQQQGQEGEAVEEMELGRLTYFGAGRWLLALREPIMAPVCFSSSYGKKTEAGKPEKKKKPKCAIL